MGKLNGKVAVVTGASKGIGAAIAKALASEGASVVVNYASSKAGADTVVADITKTGSKAVAWPSRVRPDRSDYRRALPQQFQHKRARRDPYHASCPYSAVYSGAKAALDAITGVLARELGPRKIRVNIINAGAVETEGTHTGGIIGSDFEKAAIAHAPLGRTGQVGDVALIAVFLASDDSAWLTGEQLLATGGIR